MKRKIARNKAKSPKFEKYSKLHQHRSIVPLDDAPLRKKAATEYSKAVAKLDKAREELRKFEKEERPAYSQWISATFGVMLTEYRNNEQLIQEKEMLIDEVEYEMAYGEHYDPRQAYAEVMRQRQNPDEKNDSDNNSASDRECEDDGDYEEDDCDDFNPFEHIGRGTTPEQRKAMFEDFIKLVMGLDPRTMPKHLYEMMFAQFENDLLGSEPNEAPSKGGSSHSKITSEDARIKEIYRTLVRRLHPDTRADGDATVTALWHDVQEAYASKNLSRLETIMAMLDMRTDTTSGKTSLGQMLSVIDELQRSLKTIQQSVWQAKRNVAWNFSQNKDSDSFKNKIRKNMEADLTSQREILKDLQDIIDVWSRPFPAPKQKIKPKKSPPMRAGASNDPSKQDFFKF